MEASRLRVALGPLDPAGVGRALAEGLRERGHEATVAAWRDNPYGYPADRELGTRGARLRFAARAPGDFDVLHGLGGRTFFSYLDFAWARARGVTCVLQYNGSDVRDSELAARAAPRRARIVDASHDASVRRHRRLGGRVAHAAVVQDLELASYLADDFRTIYVAPFAITAAAFTTQDVPDGPPRVLHAPSNRRIKGSDRIEAAAREAGVELEVVEGVPHSELLRRVARADIVVDQLNAETPGVLSAEAMAMGKAVICEYAQEQLASFARPSPAVQASPDTLAGVLSELVSDPRRRESLGEAGREYARRVHHPERAAAAAEQVYRHARERPPGVWEATPDGVRRL